MVFCVWFLSISIMFSNFIHVVVCISTSLLLWLNSIPLYDYTICCLSIYQLTDTWLVSTFWLLGILLLWRILELPGMGRHTISQWFKHLVNIWWGDFQNSLSSGHLCLFHNVYIIQSMFLAILVSQVHTPFIQNQTHTAKQKT